MLQVHWEQQKCGIMEFCRLEKTCKISEFVLHHNCSACKSNSKTISMWMYFTHLNVLYFTESFTWKNLPLTLNRCKANLPQIFPRLPHCQVIPGSATALTEQREAKTLEVKAPLFHHWILWKYKALDTSQTHFSICRIKSPFYWLVITGSTTTEAGCIFAIFSTWGMNTYFFPNTFISKRTDWPEISEFKNIKDDKRLGMRGAEYTAVGLLQPHVLFWRPPVPGQCHTSARRTVTTEERTWSGHLVTAT